MISFNQAVIAAIKDCNAFGGVVDVEETLTKIMTLCVTLPGSNMDIHDRMSTLQKFGGWHNTVDALNDLKIELAS